MNLMNDCSEAQEMEKDINRQRLAAAKLSTLRNATIQAMSNLLSANIDSGLMHSIGTVLF
jgi:neurofibromin 1